MWRGNHQLSECFYHLQLTIKYRRKALTQEVEHTIQTTLKEINERYDIEVTTIGFDQDHVHMMLQHLPTYSSSKVIKIIKSITAREIFTHHPEVKRMLWGGNFWTSGYYANTVGQYGNLAMITNYVKNQGIPHYTQTHLSQLTLFDH